MKKNSFLNRYIATPFIGILFVIIACTSVPQHAEANLPVHDFLNHIQTLLITGSTGATAVASHSLVAKAFIFDPLAWVTSKAVLNAVVASTVNWINSGFHGSPSFVTNLPATLLATENARAKEFLNELATNGNIKSPFRNIVAIAAGAAYNQSTNGGYFVAHPYTLNQVTQNDAAFFTGGLSAATGGFDTMFSAWSSMANNPFGASILASDALNQQVTAAADTQQKELDWGQGFGSAKTLCPTTASGLKSLGTALSTSTSLSASAVNCVSSLIRTPGATIKASLDKAVGSSIDQLVGSHQLGEIVTALMGQLTSRIFTSGGLSGLSQPSGGGGGGGSGSSYIDQAGSPNSSVSATVGLANNFSKIISDQLTSLQKFQDEWTKINGAATAAAAALANSSCSPNAGATIASTVQPVLDQARVQLTNAASSIAELTRIQNELPASSSQNGTTALKSANTASTDYSTFLQNSPISPSDFSTADTESVDTGTEVPPSLYSQMTQVAQQARSCAPLHI